MGVCPACSLQGLKYPCENRFQKTHLVGGRVWPRHLACGCVPSGWAAVWVCADIGVGSWQCLWWHCCCCPSFLCNRTQREAKAGDEFICMRSVMRYFSIFVKIGFQERRNPNYTLQRGKEAETKFSSRLHLHKYRAAPQQSIELLLPVLVEIGRIQPC